MKTKNVNMSVKVDGVWCIVIERGEYYTKVLTPLHDVFFVSNRDIQEVKKCEQ